MSKVADVHVKFIRKNGYNTLKDWMEDENNVYVGRSGIVFVDGVRFPPRASKWCNPFKTEDALPKFEIHLNKLLRDQKNIEEFLQLQGKTLGCWCVNTRSGNGEVCHAQVMTRILANMTNSK